MRRTRINSTLLFIALLSIFTACDDNRLYEENYAVDADGWHADDIKTFTFDVEDTLSPMNLWINFRTSTDYPYSNLFVFLHSRYPDGWESKDTLQFILAKPSGEWEGESSGTVVENKFLVSQGAFKKKGTYEFKIEQAMRDEVLPEIIDVGFRVELMEQN